MTNPIAPRTSASNSSTSGEAAGILAAFTVVIAAVDELFVAFASLLEVVTVAVFDTGPGVEGKVTVSAIVADPPFAMVPSEHVTVLVPLHVP